MFRAAELGAQVTREEYQGRVPELRERLLAAQADLAETDTSVIVLFGGVDGAGKGETASLLSWWMDPRLITTHAYHRPTEEERGRPEFWRFWRDLPPRGHIGVFLRAWYSKPLLQRVYGRVDDEGFDEQLERIVHFERTLADDHTTFVKLWLHLGKERQKDRLQELEADPLRSWRVTKRDWDHWNRYADFVSAAEHMIARTSAARAPWHIIEGSDPRYRTLEACSRLLEAMEGAVSAWRWRRERSAEPVAAQSRAAAGRRPSVNVLSTVDTTRTMDRDQYQTELPRLRGRLNALQRRAAAAGRSVMILLEGWDAAGKGGAIRRVVRALDARHYRVVSIRAPSDEELARHYLWRFWRRIPMAGRMVIWDRSWYGRILVERVEGLASPEEWSRAYREINEFEYALDAAGTILTKFWLHISQEEQDRRFAARRQTPYKRWKLTDEDLRNRASRAEYETAVHEMVLRTSTPRAPWTLVSAEDKRFARIRILSELCDRVEAELGSDDSQSQRDSEGRAAPADST